MLIATELAPAPTANTAILAASRSSLKTQSRKSYRCQSETKKNKIKTRSEGMSTRVMTGRPCSSFMQTQC